MGSVAYGVAGDDSDSDIYGWCIPPKEMVFPHLAGQIPGFGKQIQRFQQYQQHHIIDESTKKEYDFSIYNIVKFFQLCMDNNPNMVDALFVPERCVLHCNAIGNIVRENRRLFLHKGCWHKFRGYAYSQLHKMSIKTPEGLEEITAFEREDNISHKTSFVEVEEELKRRDLL
jgi:predicted nucleotidyltransferase